MTNFVTQTMDEWMRRMEMRIEALTSRISNLTAREIDDGVDLDDYLWSGRYYRLDTAGTSLALGYPEASSAGTLEVIRNPTVTHVQQVFHNRASGITWIRYYNGTVWGPWLSGGSSVGGVWTGYTPTFQGFTLGNGTVTGRYTQMGETVDFWVFVTLGSTSAMTSNLEVGVPVTGLSAPGFLYPMGTAHAKASAATGANVHKGFVINGATGPIAFARVLIPSTASGSTWNTITPLTWATGDIFSIRGSYEVA